MQSLQGERDDRAATLAEKERRIEGYKSKAWKAAISALLYCAMLVDGFQFSLYLCCICSFFVWHRCLILKATLIYISQMGGDHNVNVIQYVTVTLTLKQVDGGSLMCRNER